MNIADYIFLVFVAGMVLFGICQGFVKMLVDLLSNIVAFAAAMVLSRVITAAIQGFSIFDGMKQGIQEYFTNNADLASKNVSEAVDSIILPQFIKNFILKDFPDAAQTLNSGAQALAERVFYLMLLAIVCLAIFIIVRVAFYFVETILEKIFKKIKILQLTNKFLGALLGAADSVLILYIALAIVALLPSQLPGIVAAVSESAVVSKFFFNNLLLMILT